MVVSAFKVFSWGWGRQDQGDLLLSRVFFNMASYHSQYYASYVEPESQESESRRLWAF